MALIDVTDLLIDPDFVDPMAIIHRKPVIDEYGQNQLFETCVNTIGSIQPSSGKTLSRLPDALRILNVNTFWVKGIIVSDGTCQYPDILVFKGQRYAVQLLLDWTSYGPGWTEGVAIRERPSL